MYLLIAYFLGNTYAKYYENPTMLSRVTAKNVGDVFETQCIVNICLKHKGHIDCKRCRRKMADCASFQPQTITETVRRNTLQRHQIKLQLG